MLNYSIRIPQEHMDTLRVLREAVYLMAKLSEEPYWVDLYELRSRLFRPVMEYLKDRDEKAYPILEKWLLRQATTDETMDELVKLK